MTSRPDAARYARLSALGYSRTRVLSCLGGDSRRAAIGAYFDPAPDEDLFAAFRGWVHAIVQKCQGERDPMVVALLGAARLLTGDLSGADAIVEQLPETPARLDHGMGFCNVVAFEVLAASLPLPAGWKPATWTARSPEQATLRQWLADHREQLVWQEANGAYALTPGRSS